MNSEVNIIEPETLQYLPAKTLLRLVEKSQQAVKNGKALKETVSLLPDLFRRLEEMNLDVGFNLDNTWINLSFTGDGAKLGEVWGLLRRHGYKTNCRPVKGETQFYAFWEREGAVQFFMCFSSSVCRRVQIGTEMKEVPIYETQCGELPEIEEDNKEVAVVDSGEVTVADNDIPF